MYLSDMHTHSIASGHGTGCTISEMAKAASAKGLKLLGKMCIRDSLYPVLFYLIYFYLL